MFLYHYYDASVGPFKNISDVPVEEAKKILEDIALNKPNTQSAKRTPEYMELRRYYEKILPSIDKSKHAPELQKKRADCVLGLGMRQHAFALRALSSRPF